MHSFDYTALDKTGKSRKGKVEAGNIRHARALLRTLQLVPVSLTETPHSHEGGLHHPKKGSKHIRLRELSEVTRQLAVLIEAGLQVEQALHALSRHNANIIVSDILLAIRAQIMEGATLADSLEAFPDSFPVLFRASIKAGEKTGQLGLVLRQLAVFTESAYQSRQKIILALLYPAILSVVSILIIIFLMSFIVPDMLRIFTGSGQPLPALTRGLVFISNFTQSYGWLVIILCMAGGIIVRNILKQADSRKAFDRRILDFPVIGALLLQYNSARFSSTLGMMQESGVPLLQALKIASAVVINVHIREHIEVIMKKVSEGTSLSGALEQTAIFPPVLVTMAASGEASGRLGEMLVRASGISQREAENRIALLLGLFEPMILLIMGGIVLLLALAIILPILNFNKMV